MRRRCRRRPSDRRRGRRRPARRRPAGRPGLADPPGPADRLYLCPFGPADRPAALALTVLDLADPLALLTALACSCPAPAGLADPVVLAVAALALLALLPCWPCCRVLSARSCMRRPSDSTPRASSRALVDRIAIASRPCGPSAEAASSIFRLQLIDIGARAASSKFARILRLRRSEPITCRRVAELFLDLVVADLAAASCSLRDGVRRFTRDCSPAVRSSCFRARRPSPRARPCAARALRLLTRVRCRPGQVLQLVRDVLSAPARSRRLTLRILDVAFAARALRCLAACAARRADDPRPLPPVPLRRGSPFAAARFIASAACCSCRAASARSGRF